MAIELRIMKFFDKTAEIKYQWDDIIQPGGRQINKRTIT